MEKKYKIIAKASNDESIGNKGFIKQNVNDLLRYTQFLDKEFPDWKYFNVYEYTKEGNGRQVANFTKYNRPTSKKA